MRCFITAFLAASLAATTMAGAPGSKLRFSNIERSRRQGGSKGGPSSSSTHAASMLGEVGKTSVAVSDKDLSNGRFLAKAAKAGAGGVGEDIYGPFEAGFSGSIAKQATIIEDLGCSDPSKVELQGGVDTAFAEEIMAAACGMELPRMENGEFISLLDQCGGHTVEYHNHERLICLYDDTADGHSTKVGEAMRAAHVTTDQAIYGKYETAADGVHTAPLLDACGGHFGATPDSGGKEVYHYHVQDKAPFIVGCFGPNDEGGLVTVAQCRSYYTGCGDGDEETFSLKDGKSVTYDFWCPCYDGDGSNMGTKELAIFATAKGNSTTAVTEGGTSGSVAAVTTAAAGAPTTDDGGGATTVAAGTTAASFGSSTAQSLSYLSAVALAMAAAAAL